MKIHTESGQIFHNNQTTGESLHDFLRVQEDVTKKLLNVNVDINYDFEYHVREVLAGITNNRYDMNGNSTSKFLFYHFNMLRQSQGKTFLQIRHSIIADDDYALEKLQNKYWQYFVVTLIELSNNNIKSIDFTDLGKKYIIEKTFDNLQYCKDFHESVFYDTEIFFQKGLVDLHDIFIHKIEDDIRCELRYTKNVKEEQNQVELLKKIDQFFFKTGRFSSSSKLAIIPMGVAPAFVKTNDVILPFDLYKKF